VKQLHLIDGTYELFRAFYGAPSRSAPDGREVGGVYSMTMSTLGMLAESGATHVAAAFDTVIESFRNEMYVGYKTGEGMDPEILAQFGPVEEAMRMIGVTVWQMIEFETDDALATAAERWVDDVDKVVIHTPDKDMSQLYGNTKIVGYLRRERAFMDGAGVMAKFGVPPESIPDYLGLVGDTADGFPGLPGWGAKSSSTLLDWYGHIEEIPDDETEWGVKVRGAARLGAALREGRADAMLFRDLATLRRDVPIEESLDDLEWKGVPRDLFEPWVAENGFERLVERVPRWA
jgi:5'-3' exonuclease